LWWALATAGYNMVFNYVQLMWDHIEPSSTSSVYNGAVEAVCTLVGKMVPLALPRAIEKGSRDHPPSRLPLTKTDIF
jgi:hypothetical protein